MSNSIEKLTELFLQFPGIGKRQARRFVYALLHKDKRYVHDLVTEIERLKQEVTQCSKCFRFYRNDGTNICGICTGADHSQLLIVEKDADLENLNSTNLYGGVYFVLGGFISSHEKRRSFARTEELIERINTDTKAGILKEVIFGLSISPEAEHTRFRLLSMLKEKFPELSFSTLGRGLSTGTELEYSDTETLKYALSSRIEQS
jgi:recombination protein RecR